MKRNFGDRRKPQSKTGKKDTASLEYPVPGWMKGEFGFPEQPVAPRRIITFDVKDRRVGLADRRGKTSRLGLFARQKVKATKAGGNKVVRDWKGIYEGAVKGRRRKRQKG